MLVLGRRRGSSFSQSSSLRFDFLVFLRTLEDSEDSLELEREEVDDLEVDSVDDFLRFELFFFRERSLFFFFFVVFFDFLLFELFEERSDREELELSESP